MSAEVFIGLALFALVAGLVPGPNTFMFLAALIRSDDRQAFPQLLGVGWGLFLLDRVTVMISMVAGLGHIRSLAVAAGSAVLVSSVHSVGT